MLSRAADLSKRGSLTRRIESPDVLALLSCFAAAILLVPLRGALDAFPFVPFAAAFVLFMAPGVLLSCWFLADDVSGPAIVPVGFAISAGIFGLLGVPVLILHESIETYLWVAGATLAAFLAAAALRALRWKPPTEEGGAGSRPASAGWLWAPFALVVGVLVFVSRRRVPNKNDDAWVYLSWVRDLAGAERAALREPYFGHETAAFARVQLDGWLLEQAALSRVSGLDTIELVLRYFTPALVAVALLGVYALARVLLKSERAAVLCGSVYALFHIVFIDITSVHNVGMDLAIRISEDKQAARFLILPVALLFAALFVETRGRRYLGMFAFCCWSTVAIHPVALGDIGLCMLGFGLVYVAVNWRRREAWTGMVALAVALWSVALIPVVVLLTSESSLAVLYSSDINEQPPEVIEHTPFITDLWKHIYEFDDGSYIMHPSLILNPVILWTYALGIPFLLWRIRSSLAAQLLLGGLAVVTVVVYVPPVATFVGEEIVGPNLIYRLAWPIPLLALITAGWMAWEGLRFAGAGLNRFGVGRGVTRVLPLALVAVLIAASVPLIAAQAEDANRAAEVRAAEDGEAEDRDLTSYHPDPIYLWMRDNIKEPSVLLAPDSASTAVAAYSAPMNVVSYRSGAWIRDRDLLEERAGEKIEIPQRALDLHAFFYEEDLETGGYEILRRYDVDYLMIPADSPSNERLETLPGFSLVQGAPREEYSLYAVDLQKLGEPR
jgi:hypothetical protein